MAQGYTAQCSSLYGGFAIYIKLAIFMRLRLIRYAAIVLALLLSGCKFVLPAPTSATVEVYGTSDTLRRTDLTQEQVQSLASWFSSHQSGWSSSYASYAPSCLVRVKHSSGDISVVNVLPTMVVVYNRDEQYAQQFKASELSALRKPWGCQVTNLSNIDSTQNQN